MSEKMSRKEFSESLDRRLSGLQGDPWLRTKVLAKTEGEKPVKKLSAATIAVIVLLILAISITSIPIYTNFYIILEKNFWRRCMWIIRLGELL